jgi:hypothetical protein
MKKTLGLIILLSAAMFVTVGCGCGGGPPKDGLDQTEAGKQADLNNIAKRVKGDFNALTPEEKARFIALYGNKGEAKRIMKMMAHPPNEQYNKNK